MKVLIVGAGPTGLTAAIELARRGVMPTIVDQRDSASTFSRAVGITPRSLELLSHSGVSDRLIAEGIALDSARFYRGHTLALELSLHSDRTFFPTILALPQDRTEALLAKTFSALGGAVRYGVALNGIHGGRDQAVAHFSDGSEDKFQTIIGADGVGSTVRKEAGIGYLGEDLAKVWSIADVDADNWRHPGAFTAVLAAPGQVVVVVPLGTSRYRIVASTADALDTLTLPLNVTHVRREGTFEISVRQAETYSRGCVHLAGDAAHCHSPVGGRGMNLGIADAVELAKRIVEGNLAGYSALRHREGTEVIKATERGRKMISGMNWGTRTAFSILLAVAGSAEPIRRRLGRLIVET